MKKYDLAEKYLTFIDKSISKNLKIDKRKNIDDGSYPKNNIAIIGGWGSGKTTILKEIEFLVNNSEVKKGKFKNYNIIWINLWDYELTNNEKFVPMISDLSNSIFYLTEKNKFKRKKRTNSIIKKIKKYLQINTTINIPITIISKFFNIGLSLSVKKRELNYNDKINRLISEMSEEINESMKDEKRILVFFDELDRCSPQTTLELLTGMKQIVFKLKVPNVFFCATINKWQIDSSLLSNKNSHDKSYIEKIFYKTYNLEDDVECWLESENNISLKYFLDDLKDHNYRIITKFNNDYEYDDEKPFDKLDYFLEFALFYFEEYEVTINHPKDNLYNYANFFKTDFENDQKSRDGAIYKYTTSFLDEFFANKIYKIDDYTLFGMLAADWTSVQTKWITDEWWVDPNATTTRVYNICVPLMLVALFEDNFNYDIINDNLVDDYEISLNHDIRKHLILKSPFLKALLKQIGFLTSKNPYNQYDVKHFKQILLRFSGRIIMYVLEKYKDN